MCNESEAVAGPRTEVSINSADLLVHAKCFVYTTGIVTNVLQMCPSTDILQLLTDEGFNNNCACGTRKPADIKHTHQEELYGADCI